MNRMRALGLCAALAAVIGSGAVLGAARPDVRQGKNAFIRGKLAGEARPGRPQELLTSSEKLPVAIVVETWDTLFASWVNQFRSTLTLDGSQRTTESLNQFWNGIMWMNFSSDLFTYDGANRDHLTHTYREAPMGFWQVLYRETFTYAGPHQPSTILRENFNGTNFVNSRYDEFSRDGSGNVLVQLVRTWNGASWDSSSRVVSTWDGSGHELSRTFESWSTGTWVNGTRELATYDGSGNVTEVVLQYWGGSTWINGTQRLMTYDVSGNLETLNSLNWNGSAWIADYRYTEFYDGDGFLIQESYDEWDGFIWRETMISYITTDAEGFPVEIFTQQHTGDAWANFAKVSFTWQKILSDVAGGGGLADGYELSGNYPNPFNPSTEIGYTLPAESNVRLTVFNLIGKEVAVLVDGRKGPGSHTVRWNPADASSGVYFYKIEAGKFSETRRMLLVR